MENNKKKLKDKVIELTKSSDKKYREGDFKGSLKDKLEVKSLIESNLCDENIKVMVKKELTSLYNSKFDLISDHKKIIDDQKRYKIINSLEKKSKEKYRNGDFEGAIKALRRSEKYQWIKYKLTLGRISNKGYFNHLFISITWINKFVY